MRKRIVGSSSRQDMPPDEDWLNPQNIAQVEITSEAEAHPIEGALLPGEDSGWRAAGPGDQTIRLVFDEPQRLKRIWLYFLEPYVERTQEFVLRWSGDEGRSFHDIVRQQWNFSPPGTKTEVEDYRVSLTGVTVLELRITPDKSGGEARASLHQMRLA
jgi:hypothetical protein